MRLVPYISKRTVAPSLFSDSFFNDFFPVAERTHSTKSKEASHFSPRVDIQEDEKAVYVAVEIPGIAKDDIDIALKDNVLTIKGEKKSEGKEENAQYTWNERTYGSFQRAIRLKDTVKGDAVEANLENGVLNVTIPKLEEEAPKKITIN